MGPTELVTVSTESRAALTVDCSVCFTHVRLTVPLLLLSVVLAAVAFRAVTFAEQSRKFSRQPCVLRIASFVDSLDSMYTSHFELPPNPRRPLYVPFFLTSIVVAAAAVVGLEACYYCSVSAIENLSTARSLVHNHIISSALFSC